MKASWAISAARWPTIWRRWGSDDGKPAASLRLEAYAYRRHRNGVAWRVATPDFLTPVVQRHRHCGLGADRGSCAIRWACPDRHDATTLGRWHLTQQIVATGDVDHEHRRDRWAPIITAIPTCIHDGFVALERLEGVDQTYLLYALKSLTAEIRGAGQTGSQSNVNTEIVKRLAIVLPPEPEQKRVVEALRDVDQTIAALERLIAKKEAIKRGTMQELLSGDTRLSGFTGAWSTHKLSQLGVFLRGRGIKRSEVLTSGVACIRYGELYTVYRGYTATTVSFVSPSVATMALPLRQDDLLFAGSGETREEIGTCVAFIGAQRAVAGETSSCCELLV